MWQTIIQVFPVASFVLGLVAAGGFVSQRGRLVVLREAVDDYERRIHALTEERNELRAQLERVSADLDSLRRTVTGQVQWQLVVDQLTELHRVVERLASNDAATVAVLADLRAALDRLGRQ